MLGLGGEALGAMVHRIETGQHRQQHLGGANVAGGLFPADVLLAGLQGQPQGQPAFRILRHPHQTARDLAPVGFCGGKEGGVGPTKTKGHPETLGTAHGDVHPQLGHRPH